MRLRIIAAILIPVLFLVQLPTATAQPQSFTPPQTPLSVPANTVVQLTLVNPIKSKSTKPGDSIRAVVAFPVTVGSQLAIPAGTYVEGTLLSPAPKTSRKSDPVSQIHFTQLLFANGYTVPLDATQASATPPSLLDIIQSKIEDSSLGHQVLTLIGFAGGQFPTTPTLPNPPSPGPGPGVILGIGLGTTAAVIIAILIGHHHGTNSDFIVHDAGWQFQMKLANSLSLDPAQVALAASAGGQHP